MNIVNCFLFFNELDLTLLRFHELYDAVDWFVIVESRQTFTGIPKPLHFQDNIDRFAPYLSKVRYIVPDDIPPRAASPWAAESYARSQFVRGIQDSEQDDWLIISDADEVPRRSAVEQLRSEPYDRMLLELDFYYYTFNHRLDTKWRINALRRSLYLNGSQARSIESVDPLPALTDAGWHFSYLGDVNAIREKIRAYSHTEYNTPYWTDPERIQRMIDDGVELFERKEAFPITRVDVRPDTHPAGVFEMPGLFEKYIWSGANDLNHHRIRHT